MKFQKLLGVVKNERNGSFFRDRALLYFFLFLSFSLFFLTFFDDISRLRMSRMNAL